MPTFVSVGVVTMILRTCLLIRNDIVHAHGLSIRKIAKRCSRVISIKLFYFLKVQSCRIPVNTKKVPINQQKKVIYEASFPYLAANKY